MGFTVAVVAAAARGLDISCGCFGTGSGRVTWLTAARNLGLLAATVALAVLSSAPSGPAAEPSGLRMQPGLAGASAGFYKRLE